MNFSSYSNLNDQSTESSVKKILVNENPKSQFKIYKISNLKKPLSNSESFPSTCHFEFDTTCTNTDTLNNEPDNIMNREKHETSTAYGFENDSQFMNYQSSYNNLFNNYQIKSKFPRSDSLLSLSSQVDLATIENKVFSPLENQYTITRFVIF